MPSVAVLDEFEMPRTPQTGSSPLHPHHSRCGHGRSLKTSGRRLAATELWNCMHGAYSETLDGDRRSLWLRKI